MRLVGKDLLIPVGIVAMLTSMLVPMPPGIIDFLLAINLICALVLLTSSLYIGEPLKLSSLPSIILLTALYRLALNVSTTRMILGSGRISRTIEAFGQLVVQGNVVLGLVVFLVITLVQFIVIAKGSERVAEVSARFTLDSLPGKQMSIDADVRAGLIDFATARGKRQELQIESRFYGALDGAMKFVKGDAIAGMVITAVNLIGGVIIGVLQEGLPIQTAAEKYALLTVGDGLLAQIPALLNSLAAGMVVTRVGRGDNASLAQEIPEQLGQLRKVKVLIGFTALGLAFVPAMPILPFTSLACLLLFSAIKQGEPHGSVEIRSHSTFTPRTPPLIKVQVDKSALADDRYNALQEHLDRMRQRIFDRYGLVLTPPEIEYAPLNGTFEVELHGIRALTEKLPHKDAVSCITEKMETLLINRLPELVDDTLSRRLLDIVEHNRPELAGTIVPEVISLTQLSTLVRALLSEGVPVRNFDIILQAVAEAAGKINGERQLLEEVRVALRRVLSASVISESGSVRGYALDPVVDLLFSKSEREGVLLDSNLPVTLCDFVRHAPDRGAVIITSRAARALVRDVLRANGIRRTVVAFEEVAEEIAIEILGTLTVPQESEESIFKRLAA